jgi:hypothetical protein
MVRSEVPLVPPDEDDLIDPVREPVEAFVSCAAEISGVLQVIMDRVARK